MLKKEHYYLLILSFIWGTSFLFQKILTPIYGPALTAGVRLFVGGLFLCSLAVFQKQQIFKRAYLKTFLVFGIINGAIPFTLFAVASLFIPSTFSALINSMTPIATAIMAFLVLKDKLTRIQAIGLACGVGGIVISTLQGGSAFEPNMVIGLALCLGAIFSYALAFVYYRRFHVEIPSTVLGGGSQVIGGILLLAVALFWHPETIPMNAMNLSLLIVFAIFCSGIAYYLFYEIQRQMSPLESSLVTLIVPVFAVTLGVLILDEPLTLGFLLGSCLTLLGVYCVIILNRQLLKKGSS